MTKGDSLKHNNFDLLRLLFAAGVVVAHSHELSGAAALKPVHAWVNSQTMVQGFFIISGFLIVMSYEKSRSLSDYFERRARRIYPAYLVVVLAGMVLGGFFTTLGLKAFLTAKATFLHLLANLSFLNFLKPDLPGVFATNRMHAINGALWSLKIEVMFYLCVPVIVWLVRKFRPWRALLAIYLLSLAYSYGLAAIESHVHVASSFGNEGKSSLFDLLEKQLPGQLTFFMAGAAAYYYREWFGKHYVILTALSAVVLVADWYLPLGVVQPIALGVFVIYLACHLPFLGNAGRFGDVSYGLYIYHFPIIQALVALGLYKNHPWEAFAVTILGALTGAFLSWHLIEKRWLRPSSHYREATKTSPAQPASAVTNLS
ncbi:MAG: acyltransferase [Chthoniobacteraceae bacterium]